MYQSLLSLPVTVIGNGNVHLKLKVLPSMVMPSLATLPGIVTSISIFIDSITSHNFLKYLGKYFWIKYHNIMEIYPKFEKSWRSTVKRKNPTYYIYYSYDFVKLENL